MSMPPREHQRWAKEQVTACMDDGLRDWITSQVERPLDDEIALLKQRNRVAALFGAKPMTLTQLFPHEKA